MKSKIVLVIIILIGTLSYAQQDAQYTQYMYNTISINPAYAGSRGVTSIAGLHRSQWVGLDGAPVTQTLNIHSPIGLYKKIGLGVSIVNDKIGPTDETYFDIDFSYTVNTSEIGKLSFGLKAGGHLLNVNYDELNRKYTDDPLTQNNIDNRFSPNIGAGVYYHTDRFYAGISAPNLIETKHFEESSLSEIQEDIHFYLITGYVFDLNPNVKFKPALLTKAVYGAPLQVDVSANFMFQEKFILGAAYRWDAAVSALAGFQMSKSFMIGLAYDREVTELGKTIFNNGSFEVMLRYELFSSADRIITPRFF
jgi:type IX secretion system PorP/SprF family membrane protein